MSELHTVHLDRARCQGHARCVLLAPDVFDLDEKGHAVLLVDEVSVDELTAVEEAVSTCPEQAISLTQ